ncbi:hypothetical protein PALB_34880 [Pseudoalteromonas luteoviolacea B = ATCC 29581]|nr:hypothetical protein PALB_34880 [Pseudoalteromonas luteoviolacea B = ATCC 29581]
MRFYKIHGLLSSLLFLILLGCEPTASINESSPAPPQFAWLEGLDAQDEVAKHADSGDFRMIAIANRGQSLPGIAPLEQAQVKMQCGMRFVEGLGDTTTPDSQAWRKKALEYAEQYNSAMHKRCMSM